MRRAGNRWKVYICTYEVPGGLRSHREQIAQELGAIYHPSCNEQQYDQVWKDEWIGEYTAPTAGPAHDRAATPTERATGTRRATRGQEP